MDPFIISCVRTSPDLSTRLLLLTHLEERGPGLRGGDEGCFFEKERERERRDVLCFFVK